MNVLENFSIVLKNYQFLFKVFLLSEVPIFVPKPDLEGPSKSFTIAPLDV